MDFILRYAKTLQCRKHSKGKTVRSIGHKRESAQREEVSSQVIRQPSHAASTPHNTLCEEQITMSADRHADTYSTSLWGI